MTFWLSNLELAGIFVILVASYDVVVGRAGILSMAQAAFFGVGAYAAAEILTRTGLNDIFAIAAVAMVAAAVLSVPLSIIAFRISADLYIVASLGFASIVTTLFTNMPFFGNADGIPNIPFLKVAGVALDSVGALTVAIWVAAAVAVACVVIVARTRWGRMITAVRDSETGAQSLGLNSRWIQIAAVAGGSALAALAGVLYVDFGRYVSPTEFDFSTLSLIIAMLGIGGLERPWGYVAGPIILTGVPALLTYYSVVAGSSVGEVNQLIYGCAMVAAIRLFPNGVGALPEVVRRRVRIRRPGVLRRGAQVVDLHALDTANPNSRRLVPPTHDRNRKPARRLETGAPVLVCTGISKSFGRHEVLRGVDLELRPGVVTGLVGPNGCGKSTLFDILSGFKSQDTGTIKLDGLDISRTAPWARQRAGICRAFQDLRLFDGMTVEGNLEVALLRGGWKGKRERIESTLIAMGLGHQRDVLPEELAFGQKRILSVARIAASGARVVLLDEPASGVAREDIPVVLDVIRRMAAEGAAICLVEHNMEVVSEYADEVVFMADGFVKATGSPEEVMADETLADIYFGRTRDAARTV